MRYAVVIEKANDNYSAYVPDLPGCVAVGDTLEEIDEMIREAIEFHLKTAFGGDSKTTEVCSENIYFDISI